MIGGVTARTGANRGSSAERVAGSYRDLLCMGLFATFLDCLGAERPHLAERSRIVSAEPNPKPVKPLSGFLIFRYF